MPLQFTSNIRSSSTVNFTSNSRAVMVTPGLREASSAEAIAGVSAGVYMSPLGVSQAVGGGQLDGDFDSLSIDGVPVMVGAASSTDTALVRWDGTGGDALQDSGVLLDASNNMSGVRTLLVTINDASNNTVTNPLSLTHTTTGTPGAGIGVGLSFSVETSANNTELGATIEAVATDAGAGTEDFSVVLKTMTGGGYRSRDIRIQE